MKLKNLRHGAPGSNTILAVMTDDYGVRDVVLSDDGSKSWYCKAYKSVLAGKHGPVADYSPPAIASDFVKAERQRRIRQIADTDKQAYYSRVMIALLERGKETWTADEIALVDAIRAGNAKIDAIVAAAAEIEAMEPIPADFADDKYWP